MAYFATALSFMLENLGKPVVFTGSQIPLCEPYNDARRNLIMALIFAARDTVNEVSIFFHDRLLRACRSTKVNTHKLMAFDSPNLDPLATIGITIDENDHLHLPPPRGALRVHTTMDTRILTIRLVPGFDDGMIRYLIDAQSEKNNLHALVLQLYGTGNIPSVKKSFINLLADAADKGILVVATTQCQSGGVMLGHYATGQALVSAGVVSAGDMTLEAAACKLAYLCGRGDLTRNEVANLMGFPLRGEGTSRWCENGGWWVCMSNFDRGWTCFCSHFNLAVTRLQDFSPPPLASVYERAAGRENPPIKVLACIPVFVSPCSFSFGLL
jgi:L-asparaginase